VLREIVRDVLRHRFPDAAVLSRDQAERHP
jgi:hypothetical protein